MQMMMALAARPHSSLYSADDTPDSFPSRGEESKMDVRPSTGLIKNMYGKRCDLYFPSAIFFQQRKQLPKRL